MVEVIEYPKIRDIAYVKPFLEGQHVVVQEKLDGSNVAIRRVGKELVVQSRNTILERNNPKGLFRDLLLWVDENETNLLGLQDNVILYGETLHNGNKTRYGSKVAFLLFDAYNFEFKYFMDTLFFATQFNLRTVPTLYRGTFKDDLSILIGRSRIDDETEMEGIVIKAYNIDTWHFDKETGEQVRHLTPFVGGKIVREAFKERMTQRTAPDKVADPIALIAETFATDARYEKMLQKLRDQGVVDPALHQVIASATKDIHDEEEEEIKNMLFKAYWKPIASKIAQRVLAFDKAASDRAANAPLW